MEKEVTSAMRGFQKRICSARVPLQAFTGFVVPFNLVMSWFCSKFFVETIDHIRKADIQTTQAK
jgi:hypothetical protein